MARPVIVCFDGSSAASDALRYAISVLSSAPLVILAVWRELTEEMVSSGAAPPPGDPAAVNQQAREAAHEAARAGVDLARRAGLPAEPRVVRTTGAIWRAIEAVAEERDALMLVCGTGRSGLKTVMPGDTAVALVQHASRPTLVVPTSKSAHERRRHAERDLRAHETAV
jgi:nucleotide-binding universal stress UspA family protein